MGLSIVNNGSEFVCRFNTYFGEPLPGINDKFLIQENILTVGQFYIIELFISNILLTPTVDVATIETHPTYNSDGQKYFIGKATSDALTIFFDTPVITIGQTYNLDLNYVRVRPLPTYSLKKCSDDSVVKVFDPADITQSFVEESLTVNNYDDFILLNIDLSGVAEDVYYIEYEDEGVPYITENFDVRLDHSCTLQLEWGGTSDAFNFNYSTLNYSQSLRVDARLWKPNYSFDKNEIFRDSKGVRILNYIRQDKSKFLTVAEMPEYCHNALSLGIKHDQFNIDGADYVCEEQEYAPSWRKSSENAPVEIEVKKQDENLVNSNCN